MKRKCVCDEHGMSRLERKFFRGESVTPPGHAHHYSCQHQITTHPQLTRPSPSQHLPHADSPLGKYAKYLRGCYTRRQLPNTKWPPLNVKKYIQLAVINNDYANRKDLVKFREQTFHGCIDNILESKARILLE